VTLTPQWPELALHWVIHAGKTLGEIAAQAATLPSVNSPNSPFAVYVLWCIQAPCSRAKDFNPQPNLVLIYQPRKDERLSWLSKWEYQSFCSASLFAYLSSADFLPTLQSGFRPGYSTETAVLQVMSWLLKVGDLGELGAQILPDLMVVLLWFSDRVSWIAIWHPDCHWSQIAIHCHKNERYCWLQIHVVCKDLSLMSSLPVLALVK